MGLDEVTALSLRMLELEAELASVKRRLSDAARRSAAKKNIAIKRNRISAKEQILALLRAAPKHTLTVREMEKQMERVSKNTLLWNLSNLTRERESGVVRLEQGIYQLRQ